MKKGAILFLLLAVACLAVLGQQPSQKDKGVSPELQVKLDKMRAEIEANGWTFTVGPNDAMQYRLEDLCGFRSELAPLSFRDHYAGGSANPMRQLPVAQSLPASYVGWSSTVKNQASCGSCWAFGTMSELEAAYLKESGAPQAYVNGSGAIIVSGSAPNLAEQQLVSCNPWGWGCGGGNVAFDMMVPSYCTPTCPSGYYQGAMPETCFPYTATDASCSYCGTPTWTPVSSWGYIIDDSTIPTVDQIKNAIYTYGSVSTYVYADSLFQAYTGGVFNDTNVYTYTNHVIALCGWDDSKGAWLLKNSWNTGWGIGGFMWITYSSCRVGEGAAWATSNGTSTTYSMSGTVSGAVASGVTMTLGGAASATTATAADGTYTFSGLHNGNYTVKPSKSGYTFSPTSRNVTISDADQTSVNFTSSFVTYGISGTVVGMVSSGVTMTLGGAASATTTTGTTGTYSFTGLLNGSYTVTPGKSGYTFSPTSRNVTISGANQTGITFISSAATTYSISGAVSGAATSGVTMTLSGASGATTTTGTGGTYSFTGLASGSYTVTPSKSGCTFSPTSKNVTISGANQTGNNFTAAAGSYSISGTVSGAVASGVTMTLSGAAGATTTTGTGGTYSFTGLANGSYTVTPSKSGYVFSPTNTSVPISGADVTGQNFTAAASAYNYSFLDDQGRSKLCVNSGSGVYLWTILTGTGAGTSYTGTAKVTNTASYFSLAMLPGATQFISLTFNKSGKTATGAFRSGTVTSNLYDSNTANDPPGLCP